MQMHTQDVVYKGEYHKSKINQNRHRREPREAYQDLNSAFISA